MKICITGKPCSGKTTAMEYIKNAGYKIFIADQYVRSIYKAGKPGYCVIKKEFGSKYVNKIEVDRVALGKLVFSNKLSLKKLNKLMNPLIANAIRKLNKKYNWFIELGTYLYYPEDFVNLFDKIILIYTTQNWKEKFQNQKFSYLKKIPTIFVEKSKKTNASIFNIGNRIGLNAPLNVDIFVNNSENKKIFKNNILKLCKKLNQHIIK